MDSPRGSQVYGKRNDLKPLGDDIEMYGRQAAVRAGTEVLLNADQLADDLGAIQTCLILTLYWLSVAESQRNTMFSGIAYRALCTIVASSSYGSMICSCTAAGRAGAEMTRPELYAEIIRRCFWAAWIGNTLNADHYIVGASADSRMMNMPLPISEEAFEQGLLEPSRSLADVTSRSEVTNQPHSQLPYNILSELVALVWIW